MATLSDLVSVLAKATGLPEATVFAYGRFAREAGLISQKGHGRAAAKMSPVDAANLLIAVAGTGVTKEAGAAIQAFQPLKGSFVAIEDDSPSSRLIKWLSPLGIEKRLIRYGQAKLKCNFGDFITFLIEKAAKADFLEFLRTIPVVDRAATLKYNNPLFTADMIIEKGGKRKPIGDVHVGADVRLEIMFDRVEHSAKVSFKRFTVLDEEVASMLFAGPNNSSRGDLDLNATISHTSIAALGCCLAGIDFPARLKRAVDIDRHLEKMLSKGKNV